MEGNMMNEIERWLNKTWEDFYKEYYDEFIAQIKPLNDDSDDADVMITSFYNGAVFALNIADWWMRAHKVDETKADGEIDGMHK